MSEVSLRPATQADLEFAFSVKEASFRVYQEMVRPWSDSEEREFHATRFASQPFQVVVHNGEDVGVMVLGRYDGYLHLHQLFLLPSVQGQGIGAACMRIALAEADSLGWPVRLRVMKVNPRASRFP